MQTLATLRDSLPPRQRDAFAAIVATAARAGAGDDVQGHMPDPVLEFLFKPIDWLGMVKEFVRQSREQR